MMSTYIVLLRGINVSGQKKIKMADLRSMLEANHFENVVTYIQSGNVIFDSEEPSKNTIADTIEKGIAEKFGFEVPVLVLTVAELYRIIGANPHTDSEDLAANRIYYTFLKDVPKDNQLPNLNQESYPNELFYITPECVYLNCKNGAGKAKLTNTVIEKKLKVRATTRNHRTLLKLLELGKK